MGGENDASAAFGERLEQAAAEGTPLDVVAGGTKSFLGRLTQSEPFDVSGHRGVVG